MEEGDRTKILSNLVQLMRVRNIPEFHSELISRNIFTPDMLEMIIAGRRTPKEQIQKIFIEICKRGPYAFRNLVEALGRSGNVREAQLLDRTYTNDDDNENAVEEEVGYNHHHQYHYQQPQRAVDEPAPVHNVLDDADNTYLIKSTPKGYALIINVIDFDGNPGLKRVGAAFDSNNLASILKSLGYEVTVAINPKKKNLLCPRTGILKQFTDKFSIRPVDSCIVSIMSHGEDNFWFQTSDCESIGNDYAHLVHMWDDVFPRFNNQYFPMMRNKPKIFIIQSCRGDRLHRRVQVTPVATHFRRSPSIQYDSVSRRRVDCLENHPEFNHMMVLQSTLPGYVSVRHEIKGSPFIQILCEVFKTYGRKKTLMDMIPEIAKRLQELPPEDGGPQTCTFKTVGYVKKFLFS